MKTVPLPTLPTTNRRSGRPPKPGSKRSNPEYRPWSGLLRGQYVRDANLLLRKADDTRDMSDLVTELLGKWVREQAALPSAEATTSLLASVGAFRRADLQP